MAQKALRLVSPDDTSGLGRPLPIMLGKIVPFEGQPRRHFDPKTIRALAQNIQEEGQKTPVRVCKHPNMPGVFVLIAGERRFRAFTLIHDETGHEPTVNAFIDLTRSHKEHFREALLDNLHREDLVPLDEAQAYRRIRDDGTSMAEISRLTGKSYQHVDNYIRIDGLPDAVKKLMDPDLPKKERLNVTAAIDIARSIKDPKLQIEIARESIDKGLGLAETRALVQIHSGKSGYGVGGRLRKPSDDYKVFTGFVGRALVKAERFVQGMFVDGLYRRRDDEARDRAHDAQKIRALIAQLEQLLKEVEGKI